MSAPPPTVVAFGSCHRRELSDPRLWTSVASLAPDLFLWTGDAVYSHADRPSDRGSVEVLRSELSLVRRDESLGYTAFARGVRVDGTWDDHDYGRNDAGADMGQKRERRELYLDFLGAGADDPRRRREGLYKPLRREGLYKPLRVGRAKIVLLDTRSFREPYYVPSIGGVHWIPHASVLAAAVCYVSAGVLGLGRNHSAAVLGEEQWRWLTDELAKDDADATVVVSSVQVLSDNPFVEGWGHFPQERRRTLRTLNGTRGLVILSGDVHFAEIAGRGRALEVTSSGLTHSCTEAFYGFLAKVIIERYDTHRTREDMYFAGKIFGSIEFDWERMNMTVSVHDTEGKKVLGMVRKMGVSTVIDIDYLNMIP
uniref:PhoD-like phosphatase metallophosphatase domain-containing protein n=1 Tax=Corethron hystrix TaxID=216773 RepID=A0A7S1BCW5_9STRA